MLRYAEFRLDASTLKELPDGSVRVTAQLTHPGIFSYRNPDGTERREYRPADEVFKKSALDTFASAPITINHPRLPNGERLVNAKSWKSVAIGNLGENVREDAGHVVADLYIRDAGAVADVKSGKLGPFVSCGYSVDFDATPGTTPEGQRFDGVQRNIRGNHLAILPAGVAPRGGSECVLRLDAQGDEDVGLKYDVELEALKAQIDVLKGELQKARTDAAEVPGVKAALEAANKKIAELEALVAPERLDALVEERETVVKAAKAAGVDPKGKTALALKRAIVAARTPSLATRVDSLGNEAVDALLAVYADQPHPTMASVVAVVAAPATVQTPTVAARADAVDVSKVPKVADLYEKSRQNSVNAWKNTGEKR